MIDRHKLPVTRLEHIRRMSIQIGHHNVEHLFDRKNVGRRVLAALDVVNELLPRAESKRGGRD